METGGKLPTAEIKTQRTYRIEHFPGLDVILNLNYSNLEDLGVILGILRNNQLGENFSMDELRSKVLSLTDGNNRRFFIKIKDESQAQVDFIRGRTIYDPIRVSVTNDFNSKSRYARAGTLSEIILSKKIKEIITLDAVQELAKKQGFSGMKFSEPICALIHNRGKKYLIYRNIIAGSMRLGIPSIDYDPKKLAVIYQGFPSLKSSTIVP